GDEDGSLTSHDCRSDAKAAPIDGGAGTCLRRHNAPGVGWKGAAPSVIRSAFLPARRETIPGGSGCGLFARSKQPIQSARGLRKPIADRVPRDLGVRMPMGGWSPRGVLRHGPILRMVERSDLDPDVRDAVGEKGNRRTAIPAEASFGEARRAI